MILSAERDPQESTKRRWVMAQLLGLSQEQVARICPLFPKERGVKRVEDRKVLSGVIACHSEGAALGGCPGGRWTPHNLL